MRLIQEQGPAKSGKTKRLIEAANAAARQGHGVVFITHEDMEDVLRHRGLSRTIPIKWGSEEAVEVHEHKSE